MAMLCKACASILLFDPATGRLQCRNCGGSYDLKDSTSIANSDLRSLYGAEHHKQTMEFTVHTCGTCGARISFHGSEINTVCSFCGNSDMRSEGSIKRIRPDAIIPFSITKDNAVTAVKEHLAELPCLSPEYKDMALKSIRGIYIPYYIVNADYKAIMKVRRGDKSSTYYRSVSCMFDNLILEASKMLPDEASVMVEPYDIKDLKTFHEGYLQGFSSDMADKDSEDIYHQAVNSIRNMVVDECRNEKIIPRKDIITDCDCRPKFTGNPIYSLFPVWFVTCENKGNCVTFLVNGQTGKVFGHPPYDVRIFRKNVALISLITIPALFAVLYIVCRLIAYTIVIPPLWVITGWVIAGIVTIFGILAGITRYRLRAVEKAISTSTSESLLDFINRRSRDV